MRLVSSIQDRFRNHRKKIFFETFSLCDRQGLNILDLGGTPAHLFSNLRHCQVTYLNLLDPTEVAINLPEGHTYVQADARAIPFSGSSFDIVFSNSLIEHVGNFDQQIAVAKEIQRVGKAYWVQTPYKHFPIEAHYNFPFFQYLPEASKHLVHDLWPYSWVKFHSLDYEDIFLLGIEQMKQLFPEAWLYYERLGCLVKSISAVKV